MAIDINDAKARLDRLTVRLASACGDIETASALIGAAAGLIQRNRGSLAALQMLELAAMTVRGEEFPANSQQLN